MGTYKLEDQCLIPQLTLSLQGVTITGYRRGIKLICRSVEDRDLKIYNTKVLTPGYFHGVQNILVSTISIQHLSRNIFFFNDNQFQSREGAYTEYADESALKYSHVPSASRYNKKEPFYPYFW